MTTHKTYTTILTAVCYTAYQTIHNTQHIIACIDAYKTMYTMAYDTLRNTNHTTIHYTA